jgi:phosphopantothenoylcysteine decarboxylase/phosphopantothenate--cysteine ligase
VNKDEAAITYQGVAELPVAAAAKCCYANSTQTDRSSRLTLSGRHVLLIVSGGIAAYKAAELTRRLQDAGAGIRVVLTAAAQQFVTPMTLAALSGKPVSTDLFDAEAGGAGHIQLARQADLILVAPATADLIGKLANGLADDLASAILLATDRPVLLAPAMNPTMWANPAVRRNVERLRTDGVHLVGPASGAMAEPGETGIGRMAEPPAIIEALVAMLAPAATPLAGRRAIVTSGPTREPLDPIRYITNRSSGRQGHAIAASLARLGAEVHLVSGPVDILAPAGVTVHPVESALQMAACVEGLLPADVAIFAAAVGDWRAESVATGKIKKQGGAPPTLRLVENPDILATVGHAPNRPRLVIGFAAETSDLVANARLKLERKGADLIVANDVGTHAMGGATNRVTIISSAGAEPWPELDKQETADRLAGLVVTRLAARPT